MEKLRTRTWWIFYDLFSQWRCRSKAKWLWFQYRPYLPTRRGDAQWRISLKSMGLEPPNPVGYHCLSSFSQQKRQLWGTYCHKSTVLWKMWHLHTFTKDISRTWWGPLRWEVELDGSLPSRPLPTSHWNWLSMVNDYESNFRPYSVHSVRWLSTRGKWWYLLKTVYGSWMFMDNIQHNVCANTIAYLSVYMCLWIYRY